MRDQTDPSQAKDFEAERQQANELFVAGRALDALPLYEDLATRDPHRAVFAERHASGLVAKAATVTEPAQKSMILRTAYNEFLRAQSLGDTSNYLLTELEELKALFSTKGGGQAAPSSSANRKVSDFLQEGEVAFAKNDYAAALKAYTAAAAEDPKSYEAAVYAGDTAFRLHDTELASQWFAKAVSIRPDAETAYRYWGDALMQANQPDAARQKFIDAIVAQPYTRVSWQGLQQWAQRTNTQLAAPRIDRPQVSSKPNDIAIDPKLLNEDGSGRIAWVTYLTCRGTYPQTVFLQKFPLLREYRHTLTEETECLQLTVKEVKNKSIAEEKLDPSLKTLVALEASHMLEPWILLHGADQGVAQDYTAFREMHRDLLRAFIAQYDIADSPPVH